MQGHQLNKLDVIGMPTQGKKVRPFRSCLAYVKAVESRARLENYRIGKELATNARIKEKLDLIEIFVHSWLIPIPTAISGLRGGPTSLSVMMARSVGFGIR